ETAGAFDVTVGAAVPRKGESPPAVPAPIGMAHLQLDRATRTVTKAIDGLIIDLGALGKGYGVDHAVQVLRDWRIAAGLVHSGQSTLFAIGAPPESAGWRIAVRNPINHDAIIGHILLRDSSLSGSGTLLHGPHIIDPRTGGPADSPTGAWAT